jgi:periplasmic protein TonB
MTAITLNARINADRQKRWGGAATIAITLHLLCSAAVIGWQADIIPDLPDPVMVVELPPMAPPAPQEQMAVATEQSTAPTSEPRPFSAPLADVPPVRTPMSPNPVAASPARPTAASNETKSTTQAAQTRTEATSSTANTSTAGTSENNGFDEKAQQKEADYKALVGSYIRRSRFSPPQSKKAGLSGNVRVRFVVDRRGGISAVTAAQGSGHSLLDGEAVQFIQRLSPVPAFPRDLKKSEIPLTITLKFDLERK